VLNEVTKHVKCLRGEVSPSFAIPEALVSGIETE
jgi:hypothetical protein